MKTFIIEYYDRLTDYHGIGSFVILGDNIILPGDMFIVPKPVIRGSNGNAGHCAYLKPLVMHCKNVNSSHVSPKEIGGSWSRDMCYIEYDTYINNKSACGNSQV